MKSIKQRIGYLIFSIIINSFSNALMICTNLGSAVWTASSVNLSKYLHISLGTTLFVYGVAVSLLSQWLLKGFNWRIFISNLTFSFPFSYMVQIFTGQLTQLHIENYPIFWRVVLNLVGLAGIAAAISIYQRANLIQHPNDQFAYILRFNYVHENAALAQMISYIPPIAIIIWCYSQTGHIYSVGFGTIAALLLQGSLIGSADKYVFPSLKHHKN